MPDPITSLLDKRVLVSQDTSVVSLVVKEGDGAPNHAFLVIQIMDPEGYLELRTHSFGFYSRSPDEQKKPTITSSLFTTQQGAIFGRQVGFITEDNIENVFQNVIMKGSKYVSHTLSVPTETVTKLNVLIEQQTKNPPDYYISGGDTSAARFYRNPVHNCLSWLIEVLIQSGCESRDYFPNAGLVVNLPRSYIHNLNGQDGHANDRDDQQDDPATRSCCIIL